MPRSPKTPPEPLNTPVEIDHDRIRLGSIVLVLLERTIAPPDPLPPGVVPRTYGLATPAFSASGEILAAVPSGEAVWLGFQAVDPARPAIVRVRVEGPRPRDAVTGEPWKDALADSPRNHLVCPPDYALPGECRAEGFVPFGQERGGGDDVVGEITVIASGETTEEVAIRLLTAEGFTTLTGAVPEPLDPDAGYKGWRLP